MLDRFSLKNKIIILTGGAGFLARFHIKALNEKKGTIIVIDKNYESLINQKNFLKIIKKFFFIIVTLQIKKI